MVEQPKEQAARPQEGGAPETEQMRILRLIQETKVTPEEGARLLEALGRGGTPKNGKASGAQEPMGGPAVPWGFPRRRAVGVPEHVYVPPLGEAEQALRDAKQSLREVQQREEVDARTLRDAEQAFRDAEESLRDAQEIARAAEEGGEAVMPAAGGPGKPSRMNFGKVILTSGYLSHMQDGTAYTNFGKLVIAEEVPEELLRARIARYDNFGETAGPSRLLTVLEDRGCNFGNFAPSDES